VHNKDVTVGTGVREAGSGVKVVGVEMRLAAERLGKEGSGAAEEE
jgi:hypothetical protein